MELSAAHKEALAEAEQGRFAEAEALLRKLLAASPQDQPARRAVAQLRLLQAEADVPADPAAAVDLAQTLAYMRGPLAVRGADEGPRLDRAAEIVLQVLADVPDRLKPTAANILWRAGEYAAARALGDAQQLMALAVDAGLPHALLYQLAKVETDRDRLAMMAEHRRWAERLEAAADAAAIVPPPSAPREKLRLGFLSSDLRIHVVAWFVQPLFEFIDPRFDLFIYSAFEGPSDQIEQWFETQSTGLRRLPPGDREAAQMIADDDLDMLIDLGGPTAQSRPGVLAYKPARVQASWLGYPHSLGLAAIDHYIADPFLTPRPDLLFETALPMPASWICMTPAAFQAEPGVTEPGPAARQGYVTFGTANDVYKWTPRTLGVWARVMAATPGSRFIFVRPETGSKRLQAAVTAIFAEAGVSADRLEFRALRGPVRQAYADIDIALDTFPVTGGTTTCDAIWMGAPTVTLVGPAPYERVSNSIMTNLGLADLCAETVEDYERIAVELARSPERIAELRGSLRTRIRVGALGQPRRFAADFYEMIAGAVARPQPE